MNALVHAGFLFPDSFDPRARVIAREYGPRSGAYVPGRFEVAEALDLDPDLLEIRVTSMTEMSDVDCWDGGQKGAEPVSEQQRFGQWWKSQTMGGRVITGATVAILVFGLGSYCSEGSTEPTATTQASADPVSRYVSEYGGQRAVYERIAATTDCAALQQEFDIAADNNDRAEAGTDESRWTLGYMTAADERLEEVGCYG